MARLKKSCMCQANNTWTPVPGAHITPSSGVAPSAAQSIPSRLCCGLIGTGAPFSLSLLGKERNDAPGRQKKVYLSRRAQIWEK